MIEKASTEAIERRLSDCLLEIVALLRIDRMETANEDPSLVVAPAASSEPEATKRRSRRLH